MKKRVLIMLLLLAAKLIAQTQIDTTNIYSFTFEGVKYEIIKEAYTWEEAAKIAVERTGILAEINSQEEQDTIFYHLSNAEIDITKTVAPDGGGASYVWLGGNDLKEEGAWIWDGDNNGFGKQFWEGIRTGTPINGLYSNWGLEPDNFNNQDGLGLAITNWPLGLVGQWNDILVTNEMYFVIEYDNSIFKVENIDYLSKEYLINIDVNFLYAYDSIQVMVDSMVVETFFNVTMEDSTFTSYYKPIETKFVNMFLRSFRDTIISFSNQFSYKIHSFVNPLVSYSTDFEDLPFDDFLIENFDIKRGPGFRDKAINSSHNYENNLDAIVTIKKAFIVDPIKSQLLYSDVAIVEPGDSGSSYGEAGFKDYVIVEGSKIVDEWIPLAPAYDARAFPDWEEAWETPTLYRKLYKQHSIELTDSFNSGDTILIRFRLYSDEENNGFGWIIDSLQIQEFPLTDIKDEYTINKFSLEQNYPNPFNPSTTIKYSIPTGTEYSSVQQTTLKVYDILGREIATLINKEHKAGNYEVQFNASSLRSGVYFYKLESNGFIDSKKMILLR